MLGKNAIQNKIGFAAMLLLGAVVGYALGYMVLLDPLEEVGHRLFWLAISNGHVGDMNISSLIGTTTFWKLLISSLVGGGASGYAARQLFQSRIESATNQIEVKKAA